MKQKFKKFFTLDHRKSDGFTLIELIVVIAIMAILAGVGTAGYGAYIKSANKGADRKLVGDVMRAIQTSGNSYMADFAVEGQFSTGLQLPVGYVVLTTDGIETESEAIDKALQDAFGADYKTNMKLKYTEWEAGTVGGSTLHNAAAGMMNKIDVTAKLMIGVQKYIDLASKDYENANDLIISVSKNIAGESSNKEAFVQQWMNASTGAYDQQGFGYTNREDYSAVRMAYNNAFAEYVRANYNGDGDANAVADSIANYGQSAGDLAASKAPALSFIIKPIVNGISKNATFPYTANESAFSDPNYIGSKDQAVRDLYDEWIAGPAKADAEMFYDMMKTVANDGAAYVDANGGNKKADFVNWFSDQANAYSDNVNAVQDMVDQAESSIAIVAYYTGERMDFDVYSAEADPRNEK